MNQLKIEAMFLEQSLFLRHPNRAHDPADGAPVEPDFLLGAGGGYRREKNNNQNAESEIHNEKRKGDRQSPLPQENHPNP
jgi:hypothetical protein